MARRISRWFAFRSWGLAWMILAMALLSSAFWYQANHDREMRYFPFAWRVHWITSPYPDSKTVCFRKTVFVRTKPQKAYLVVAARNFYRLQINGRSWKPFFNPSAFRTWVQQQTLYSSLGYPRRFIRARVYEISTVLKPGRNVISLLAQTDESNPQIAIQGRIFYVGGQQEIASDASWKCAPEQRISGTVRWNSPAYRDTNWDNAVETKQPVDVPVDGDISSLEDPLHGQFITIAASSLDALDDGRVRFRRTYLLPDRIRTGWLRLSTTAHYELALNGLRLGSTAVIPRFNKPFYGKRGDVEAFSRSQFAPLIVQYPALNRKRSTHLYLLKNVGDAGTLTLEVTAQKHEVPEMRDIPAFHLDGKLHFAHAPTMTLQTDTSWEHNVRGKTQWKPVEVAAYAPVSYPLAAQERIRNKVDGKHEILLFLLQTSTALFALFLGIAALLETGLQQMDRRDPPARRSRAVAVCVLPLAVLCVSYALQNLFAFSPQSAQFDSQMYASRTLMLVLVVSVLSPGIVLGLSKWKSRAEAEAKERPITQGETKEKGGWISEQGKRWIARGILTGIMITAYGLYTHQLGNDAYLADEYVSIYAAQGIQKHGYPLYEYTGFIYTRSAIFHYLLALFLTIGGGAENPMATRFLATMWQLLLIPVCYFFGKALKGRATGLIAAALAAYSPYLIFYAREVRFYTQFAFFITLTVFMFWQSVRFPDRFWYRPAVLLAFIGAYLSQQFSFTILPPLIMIIALSGQTRLWLNRKVTPWLLFTAIVMILDFVLFMKYCQSPLPYVDIEAVPLMAAHIDTLEVLPSLLLFNYERAQFVTGFLFLAGTFGVCFHLWRSPNRFGDVRQTGWRWWSFLYLIVWSTLVLQTIITPRPSSRYIVQLVPLVVITAACLLTTLGERLVRWGKVRAAVPTEFGRLSQAVYFVAVSIVCIAAYRPQRTWNSAERSINRGTTDAARYVARNLRKGDKVMFSSPEIALVELGHCDYMWRPRYGSIFKYFGPDGRLRERNSGAIVIDSTDKLRAIMARDERIWIVIHTGSMGIPGRDANGELALFVLNNFSTVYEPFNMQVMLWDKKQAHFRNSVRSRGYDLFDL